MSSIAWTAVKLVLNAYYAKVCPVVPQLCSGYPDWGSQCKMQLSLPIMRSHVFACKISRRVAFSHYFSHGSSQLKILL